LNAKLEVYEQNPDANAQRAVDRLGFDQSPDGNRIRQYHMKCNSGFFRAFETCRKYKAKKGAERGERRIEYGGLGGEDSRRRIPDAARWPQPTAASDHVADRSFVMGMGHAERETFEPSIDSDAFLDPDAQPGYADGTTRANESASADMMADTILADGVTLSSGTSALTSVTPPVDITLPAGSELAVEQVAAGPIESLDDGRLVATILVGDAEGWFGRLLLRLGPGTEVLSPPELRSAGVRMARRALDRYGEGARGGARVGHDGDTP